MGKQVLSYIADGNANRYRKGLFKPPRAEVIQRLKAALCFFSSEVWRRLVYNVPEGHWSCKLYYVRLSNRHL